MSTTVQVLCHLPTAVAGAVPMAATNGILDWATAKIDQLQVLFKAFSVVAGIGFVIWQAVSSRGALARIVISGLAAGLFIWIVWNVTSLQDRVGHEVSLGPPVVHESGARTSGASPAPTAAPGLPSTSAATAPWAA